MPLDELLKKDLSEEYQIDKWKLEGVPKMLNRIREATQRMKKEQEKNMARRNKETRKGVTREKEGRQFEEGDKVLIRRHPTTNKDNFEHKKMKLPWEGPYEIGVHDKEKYPSSYKIIKDDGVEEVINEKNIKKFFERPAWMISNKPEDWHMDVEIEDGSEKESDEFIPEVEKPKKNQQAKEPKKSQTTEETPKKVRFEDRPVEIPNNVRRSKRVDAIWKPKVGDLIDIRFYYQGKKRRSCLWS